LKGRSFEIYGILSEMLFQECFPRIFYVWLLTFDHCPFTFGILSTFLKIFPDSDRKIVNGDLLEVLLQCEEILSNPWMAFGNLEKVRLMK
jgi:hypothetical protein